jgi:hypothetical protein
MDISAVDVFTILMAKSMEHINRHYQQLARQKEGDLYSKLLQEIVQEAELFLRQWETAEIGGRGFLHYEQLSLVLQESKRRYG